MSEVLKAIEKRSSIRKYRPEELPQEIVEQLIRAGLQAPTAANRQEVHFSVVHSGSAILHEVEQEKRTVLAAGAADEQARKAVLDNPSNFYYDAPVVIFLSADREISWGALDAGIAVENIALAAQGLGLGSLIIGIVKPALTGEKAAYFAEKLQFPENYAFEVAIAVGYKDTEKEPHEYDAARSVSYIR